MSGYDIQLDMTELTQLRDDLVAVVGELKGANDNADATADATGHDELRDRVHDFSHKWKIKREEMLENAENLQQILSQIVDAFTKVDADLARSLEEAAAS
ncbi:hypothetical protein [Cellulomonas sp. PhB143]|uniref:hypothetical protein n=1 Tax=Cellulomonas sp. PhB143 TaxID=2485186 RepID=UPI000FADB229|nr:hypothetical protein [Cellulomonas sp. PhB143]ROS76734.1 hypothetical protein EDF32_1555 [Cellulomonas sp. PhB143]